MLTAPITRTQTPMQVIAALLERRTGQQIAPTRAWRVETALKPVLRDRNLVSLAALAQELVAGGDRRTEDEVIDALLNQESSFFRDVGVLDLVADACADMQARVPGRRLRLWSAGCSIGQEPLSLAMLFAERDKALLRPDILATDVSDRAIRRARAGRYTQFEIQRGLPVRRMMQWFVSAGDDWVATPELIGRVAYRRLNLIDDAMPVGRFDVVLCRNVLLYLSLPLRRRVLDRLAGVMRPGGLLVLGAGETVIGQSDAFRPSTVYRGLYELAPPA